MRSYGINLVGIILEIMIIFLAKFHRNMNKKKKSLFILTASLLMAICVASIVQCIVLYFEPKKANIFLNIMQAISFTIMCLLPQVLASINNRDSGKKELLFFIPHGVNLVLNVISIFKKGIVFYFDTNFVYTKGPFYYVSVAIAFYSLIVAIYYVVRSIQCDSQLELGCIIGLFLLSALSFVIEMLTNQYYLFYNVTAGLVMGYFSAISLIDMRKDPLANTYNRAYFKCFIEEINKKQNAMILMYDCNGLKEINDTLGHAYGDKLIAGLGTSLVAAYGKAGRVFRYGGDEFYVIITKERKFPEVINMIERYESIARIYNVKAAYGLVSYDKNEDIHEALTKVDELMYENKRIMKTNGSPR